MNHQSQHPDDILQRIDEQREALATIADLLEWHAFARKLEPHLDRPTVALIEAVDLGEWGKLKPLYREHQESLRAAIDRWQPRERAALKRNVLAQWLTDMRDWIEDLTDRYGADAEAWLNDRETQIDRLLSEAAPWIGDLSPLRRVKRDPSAAACRTMIDALEEFRLRIKLDAPVGQPDPAARKSAKRAVEAERNEEKVKQAIFDLLKLEEVKLCDLTRDRIAKKAEIAQGIVSGTKAWRQAADEKKRTHAPRNRADAAQAAKRRGDWKECNQIMKEWEQETKRDSREHDM